jgi:hypothetical protein
MSAAAQPMVTVTALSAQIAATAAKYASDEFRKLVAKNPNLKDLARAADAQERAANELQAAVDKLVQP